MLDQTWRFDSFLAPDALGELCDAAKAEGIACQTRSDARYGVTYALAHVRDAATGQDFAARRSAAAAYEPAIIALAIEPQTADALPGLFEALGGVGAPAGMVSCEVRAGAAILEFTPSVSPWQLIRCLVDAELRRFGGGARTTTLLSPLTLQMQTQIAADGLECADMLPDRVLEALLDADR